MSSLSGLTVAVTRPIQYAGELGRYLTAQGARVILAPTLELKAKNFRLGEDFNSVDSLIFISQFSVHAFFEQFNQFSKSDERLDLSNKRFFAIGEKNRTSFS
ncbi:uroporphyrinogen-III synthase [Piscirickettsia litoralis]|uniref:uroporphyrinogen-III synthase n=1 Tax=Piscirickettsia litoralis TaxID=1891921 RepID=UPI001112FC3C|nr:uroporphyrinogen-III synthase [Piscirickettsia litoralis]